MDGLLRCSRYAFGPNRLHYCGPDANREIFDYIRGNQSDFGLKAILEQFRTMFPYLRRIADSNDIADPFDDRVVEAYWLGNRLLENVNQKEFYDHLVDDHGLKKKLDPRSFSRLADSIARGALPHHSFHVFAVWKRTGHNEKAQTLESVDSCRISWGEVLHVDGPFITVKTKPLILKAGKLALGEQIQKRIARCLDSYDDIERIAAGEIVSIHWDVPCEVITRRQVAALERYTEMSLQLANQIL